MPSPLSTGADISQLPRPARPAKILLPEPQDARVLAAAVRAQQDGMAHCLLLGESEQIQNTAAQHNIALPSALKIIAPNPAAHIAQLQTLRAARGKPMDDAAARALLQNPVAQGALLVQSGAADGMVAGAVTASADVLRPALQIVGLQKGAALASSAFLMCFADGIKVFADCALNIQPNAQQLAHIAVQSANTARRFGLDPVVAMLSYSSGASGSGAQVDVARAAAKLAQDLAPHLAIVAPIQYDAAVNTAIAKIKLPDDPAAGRANVLVFPDLQSGNIAYKAVQQSANIVSVGPLMQGLAAPINDLSRGATSDDIYHTIAATSVAARGSQ